MSAGTKERRGRNIDPTAGVTLALKVIYCPRCGYPKPGGSAARVGLCSMCTPGMTPEERAAWR